MKHPSTPGEVWIHIDKIDKKNKRIWAIQDRTPRTNKPRYRTATEIVFDIRGNTRQRDESQPRACLRMFDTSVEILQGVAYVTSVRGKKWA